MIARSRVLRHLRLNPSHHGAGYAGQAVPQADAYLMPLILDAPLPIGPAGGHGDSLLMLPVGSGLLVDQLVKELSVLGHHRITIVSPLGDHRPYEDRLDPDLLRQLRIVKPHELPPILAKCEASDYLLVVDPRYWPIIGFDFGFIAAQARSYQGATHAIAVGATADGTRERVEYDSQGNIRRVQRLYSPMSWPATTAATVFCSVAPARALCDTPLRCLGELRCQLVGRGVLAQDLPVLSGVDRLTSEEGILARSQRVLTALLAGPQPEGLRLRNPGVLIGEGCRIDPSVRLVPPVLIQDFATIEPEVTLVGPVLIGSGSRVARRAIVGQTIVMPGSLVPQDAAISNVIRRAQADGQPEAQTPPLLPAPPQADIEIGIAPPAGTSLQDLPGRHVVQRVIKRTVDIVLAAAGLLVLSPLLLAVAGLIKCTSPGPIFFVHRREGEGGRPFGCIKFRTMVPDAHARQRDMYTQNQVDGPQFKMDSDPRVTRVGAWLRTTNIDELPQLFNVLAGQMSLVGPRPSPFRENQICVAWRRARLSVQPGITGLWQICRDRRCDGDFHQWIFYDITYVRHFSLRLDLKILAHTLLSGGGRKRVALSRLLAVQEPTEQRQLTGNGQ